MLARTLVAPRDFLLDTPEAQCLALLFDHFLLWPLDRWPHSSEETSRLGAEQQFLREQGLVLNLGMSTGMRLRQGDGQLFDPGTIGADFVVPLPLVTTISAATSGSPADSIARAIAQHVEFPGGPLCAYASAMALPPGPDIACLEIVLQKLPLPPSNTPWDVLLQFKVDPENQSHLRRLRIWTQQRATAGVDPRTVGEELESMLHDYTSYMKLQHRKYGEGVISTLLVATADAVQGVLNLNLGDGLRALLDFRARRIALSEAELLAPGRELAYIARARRILGEK